MCHYLLNMKHIFIIAILTAINSCILLGATQIKGCNASDLGGDKYKGVVTDFSYNVSGIIAYFGNKSQNSEISFEWTMGDGTVMYEQSFEYRYRTLGHFEVCLFIKDKASGEVINKTCKMIEIGDPNECNINWEPVCGCDNETYMNACFAEKHFDMLCWKPGPCPSKQNGIIAALFTFQTKGLEVNFQNASTGRYDTYQWSFGKEGKSKKTNPKFTFPEIGYYNVCLTVTNSATNEQSTYCENIKVVKTVKTASR